MRFAERRARTTRAWAARPSWPRRRSAASPARATPTTSRFGQLGGGCSVGRCGTTSGDSLSFTSDAPNLTRGDRNGQPDIYQRDFYQPVLNYKQRRAGKKAYLQLKTSLVSRHRVGPGRQRRVDPLGVERPRQLRRLRDDWRPTWSRTTSTTPPTSSCAACTSRRRTSACGTCRTRSRPGRATPAPTSRRSRAPASILFYESDASNLQPNPPRDAGIFYDRNCARDVFFWNYVSTNASLQSRNSNQEIPNLPENSGGGTNDAARRRSPTGRTTRRRATTATTSCGSRPTRCSTCRWPSARCRTCCARSPARPSARTRRGAAPGLPALQRPEAAEAEFPPSEWPLPERGTGAPGSVPVGLPVTLP